MLIPFLIGSNQLLDTYFNSFYDFLFCFPVYQVPSKMKEFTNWRKFFSRDAHSFLQSGPLFQEEKQKQFEKVAFIENVSIPLTAKVFIPFMPEWTLLP